MSSPPALPVASAVDRPAVPPTAEPSRPAGGPGRIARPEHAAKLAALLSGGRPAQPTAIAFYGTGEVSEGVRLAVPARGLAQAGARVKLAHTLAPEDLAAFDVFVFSRPHLAPALLEGMLAVRQAGQRLVVDVDDDFHQLPPDHPGYRFVGPGSPEALRRLEFTLAQADLVTVATPVLAERYGRFARRVAVIPNGWDSSNPAWAQPLPPRATLNIGWAGTRTHRADVELVRTALVRVIRRFPQTHLVIGGDPQVYELFAPLPERRRSFRPMVAFDDYPALLAQFDIWLAPLQANAFNQAKSDIKLVEAGARGLPWVASPLPAYRAWAAGGLLADTPADWLAALERLIQTPDLRHNLGQAGRQKAAERSAAACAARWQAVLADLTAGRLLSPAAP